MQPIEPQKYTGKQGQYLAFIYHYTKIHQVPSSQRDIQLHFNTAPPDSVPDDPQARSIGAPRTDSRPGAQYSRLVAP
jgi:hypothetical protein